MDYASARGWAKLPSRRSTVAILGKPGISEAEITVPLDRTFRDYPQRLLDALEIFAGFENLVVSDVYVALTLVASDVLRWRREDLNTRAGTLLLEDGIAFFDGARRAFLASAHTALDPERYYRKLGRREAEAFVDQCRMGPTAEGSFIATFFCPVDLVMDAAKAKQQVKIETFSSFEALPFGRQVTRNVIRQLARLADAASAQDVEILTKTTTDDPMVVSGNFCDAVLQMASQSLRELSVSVAWSSPLAPNEPTFARIREDDLPAVETFAKQLRPVEENKPETLVGKIGALKASPDKDKRGDGGEVTLHTTSNEGPVRARLHLGEGDYQKAIRAHDLGLNVAVVGVLERCPGHTLVGSPHNFRILDELFDRE